jgi:curli biogenesis system outer membrane secretion channel CsgG
MIRSTCSTLALAVVLAACATPPPAALVRVQPAAVGPRAVPQRNLTHFADGLRCMDDMLHRFGVRDVSVMIEEMQDQSRRLGVGTRDMMVSAFADMTRRSRGLRLVTFGQDNQNIVQLLSLAQKLSDFKVVPQYDIRGSITQFDEDVERSQAGFGASVVSALTGPLFGVRFDRTEQSSVMGFDASVISTTDLSLMPGVSSRNTVIVQRDETSAAGEGQALIRNSSLSLNFAVSRNEGVAQSLRNMVELATIELAGKLLRLPYWSCLNLDPAQPEIQREMQDWFLSMQGSAETTRFFQEQLRFRKFYDGPADGKANPAYAAALAAYREAVQAPAGGEPDFEVWQAFLLRPIPAPPAKPFTLEPAAAAASAPAQEIQLALQLSKQNFRRGEPIALTLTAQQAAHVYCYVQSPANGKIQRIFPNRFARDPRIAANTPLLLPGEQGFQVLAGGEGVTQQTVGCLATTREVYNDLPPALRWGDFEDIRLGTFEDIRAAFAQVANAPVALEAATIDVAAP